MIRAVLALLLLVAVLTGFSGEARAHAGMAGHGAAVAGAAIVEDAAPASGTTAVPPGSERSPGHLPAGKCCMMTAGCGNASSILAGAPLLPVPGQVATVELATILDAPRSLDLPVADRPPRST